MDKIVTLRREMTLQKYKSMLHASNDDFTRNKISSIINQLNLQEQVKEPKNVEKKQYFDEYTDLMFKKPWQRLPEVHKIMKIREYVSESLLFCHNQEDILDKLINMVKEKKLKGKMIKYDSTNGKIVSITDLKYDNKSKCYFFN